jgi:hypothetical protein
MQQWEYCQVDTRARRMYFYAVRTVRGEHFGQTQDRDSVQTKLQNEGWALVGARGTICVFARPLSTEVGEFQSSSLSVHPMLRKFLQLGVATPRQRRTRVRAAS